MFRVVTPTGHGTQSPFIRWSLTTAYLCFAIAGIAFILSDVMASLLTARYGWSAAIIILFIIIGGLLCAFGAATRRWIGEFLGIPLLGTGLIALGLEVFYTDYERYPYIAIGNFLIFAAVTGILIARWRVIVAVVKFVHAVADAEKKGLSP